MHSAGCTQRSAPTHTYRRRRGRQRLLGGAAPLGSHAGVTLPVFSVLSEPKAVEQPRVPARYPPHRARFPPLAARHVSSAAPGRGGRGLGPDVTSGVRAREGPPRGWAAAAQRSASPPSVVRLSLPSGGRGGPHWVSSWPPCRFFSTFFLPSPPRSSSSLFFSSGNRHRVLAAQRPGYDDW